MKTNKLFCLVILSVICFSVYTQANCPKNCESCNNSTSCSTCKLGYYLNNNECRPCNQGCKNCTAPVNGSTVPTCSECREGFNLNPTTNQCFSCDLSCKTCFVSPQNCTSCREGLNLTFSSNVVGICQRDPNCLNDLCLVCRQNSTTLCQSCISGYYLRQNGNCSKCPYPCRNCQFDINATQVIQNFNNGIQQIQNFVSQYNAYLSQLEKFLTAYQQYIFSLFTNPNSTLDIFLAGGNFSLLGNTSDLANMNFSDPGFNTTLFNLKVYFTLFVDDDFFRGISNKLDGNMNGMHGAMNGSNYSNFENFNSFGNYSDFFGNMSNFNFSYGNMSNFNGSFGSNNSSFNFGNYSANNTNMYGNFSDFFGNYSNMFGNYSDFFGNGSNYFNFGNFSFGNTSHMGNMSINKQFFLRMLYDQKTFRRYFNGTFEQLKGPNASLYFNFQNAPASCRGCIQGFFFNNTGNFCKPCQRNCAQCNQTMCIKCEDGYTVTNSTQCAKCQFPCKSCSSNTTRCTSCFPPMTLTSSQTCITCSPPCETCQSSNKTQCITCRSPYSSFANTTTGQCFRCKQDVCKVCQQSNTSICIQCSDGHTLVDGKCEKCPKKCTECSQPTSNSTAECYKCEERYVVNTTTKQCQKCGPGCLVCKQQDTTICVTCETGTYKNDVGTCIRCSTACSECTNAQSCTSYKDGILMFGNQIIECRPGCKKCDSTNPEKCLECEERFVLSGTVCRPCAQGCAGCDSSNTTICTSCPTNRYLNGNQCSECPKNCTSCNSSSICTACKRGFTLSSNNCVEATTLGGAHCQDASGNGTCSECDFGYVLAPNGKCAKCTSSCGASCDSSNPLVCTSCTVGFQSIQGQCVRCPNHCKTCNDGICSQCARGYQLLTSNTIVTCQRSCIFPCKSCSANNTCFTCAQNFTLTNGVCQPDLTCGGSGCLYCPIGSYKQVSSGQCVKCSNNCASCDQTQCYTCREGYYLDSTNNTCASCPQGSAICLDSATSTLCKPGYLLQATSIDSTDLTSATYSTTCQPCQSPCLQCMMLPTLCVSCINNNYRLNGTSCLKKLVVGVQIRFDYDYTTFLEEGAAQNLLNILMAKVKATIVFTFMRSGSTVVGMALGADDSSSASSVKSGVSAAIDDGSLGMPVVSSSVGLYFQDSPYNDESSGADKAGMIAGIVVGVVVAAVIIGVIIYKFKKSRTHMQLKPDSNSQMIDMRAQNGNTVNYPPPQGYPPYHQPYQPYNQPSTQNAFQNNKILFA